MGQHQTREHRDGLLCEQSVRTSLEERLQMAQMVVASREICVQTIVQSLVRTWTVHGIFVQVTCVSVSVATCTECTRSRSLRECRRMTTMSGTSCEQSLERQQTSSGEWLCLRPSNGQTQGEGTARAAQVHGWHLVR